MMDEKQIIMVVDDQPDFIEGVKLILEAEGYEVWTAFNGQNALDSLQESFTNRHSVDENEDLHQKYLPDLILADIMMPTMDGYALHDNIRGNPFLNHIPFVFLSAKTDDPDIRHGKELGADDYLTKPCQPDDLLATVRGKLKRTSQRRAISAQFMGNPSRPSVAGIFIIVSVLVAIVAATAFVTLMIAG